MRSGVIAVLLIAALAGCARSGRPNDAGNGSRNESALVAALSKVRATDSTRKFVEYGSVRATRALAEADRARFYTLHMVGLGNVGPWSPLISTDLGFDPRLFQEGISAGVPGSWAGILWGDYDVNATNARFATFGIERSDSDGATTWTIDADNRSTDPGPLDMIAGEKTLNIARTQPGSFAYAVKRDTLAWITNPGQDTLAKDPTIKALATCLGDVVAAVINREGRMTQPLAVGIRAPSASDITAVICVAPGARDQAEKIRATASATLPNGTMQNGQPWSQLLPDATTELTGDPNSVVRIIAKPAASLPLGNFVRILPTTELSELLGVR
jgi:hypothetical protein